MKDFVSRLTFGFLMAQLFPGAVTVFALTFAYLSFEKRPPNTIVGAVNMVLNTWEEAPLAHKLFLAGLFVAFGMLIHGIHWMILGALEHERNDQQAPPPPPSLFDFPRDRIPLGVQFLIGPFRFFHELYLVSRRPGFIRTAIRENVARIKDPWMKQHEFMQDFYLHTAQFFAHTSYALVACMFALVAFVSRYDTVAGDFTYGLTWRRSVLLVLLYLASSAFFILARLQFATLFTAERELIAKSDETPLPRQPPRIAIRRRPRRDEVVFVLRDDRRPLFPGCGEWLRCNNEHASCVPPTRG